MLRLHYHPFASFCQKALIALYEKELPFERKEVSLGVPEEREALKALWPFAKFPVLEHDGRVLAESGVIIEYLDRVAPDRARMVPADPDAALEARTLERVFDNQVATQVTKVVTDHFRPEGRADPQGVEEAKAMIATAYDFFEARLAGRQWAAGDAFGLADCAAAPALFYAGTVMPLGERPTLKAYYERLLARPSFARVIEEARFFRPNFPLPWPNDYR